jgi:hypothetical protein
MVLCVEWTKTHASRKTFDEVDEIKNENPKSKGSCPIMTYYGNAETQELSGSPIVQHNEVQQLDPKDLINIVGDWCNYCYWNILNGKGKIFVICSKGSCMSKCMRCIYFWVLHPRKADKIR